MVLSLQKILLKMSNNCLKYALRSFGANKLCSAISIVGLGLGLACTIVIAKYVYQEYTTDYFHHNVGRLYCCAVTSSEVDVPRLGSICNWKKEITDYPEVEASADVQLYAQAELTLGKQIFNGDLMVIDTNIYNLFTFQMLVGDLKTVLSDPGSMVVTRRFAEKVFGQGSPLGEELQYQGMIYKISGIVEDWPVNSSFSFDVLVPSASFFDRMSVNFILLKDRCDIREVNQKLAKEEFRGRQKLQYKYMSFEQLYFNSGVDRDIISSAKEGDSRSLLILMLIGGVILAISVFNYINIYQVALLRRNKELGVKRVYGVTNQTLFSIFWSENFLLVVFATFIAGLSVRILSGYIESKIGVPIRLNLMFDVLLFAGILVVLPVLTSMWPFLKYRHIRPALAVKNSSSGRSSSGFRRTLLAVQYVMTTVMIIVSFYFMEQLNFMLNREIGLNHENVAHVVFFREKRVLVDWLNPKDVEAKEEKRKVMKDEHERNVQYVKNELTNCPYIFSFCVGDSPLRTFSHPWKLLGDSRNYQAFSSISLTPGFDRLYGLKVKEGRFFDMEKDKDRENKVVINEAARRYWGIGSIEDVWIANNYWGQEASPWKVIGVVEDFHYEHLAKSVQPLIMFYFDDNEDVPYQIGVTKGKEQEAIAFLHGLFQKVNSEGEFSYRFFDDEIKAQYDKDQKLVRIFSIFTILAVFISSMGLFGFAFFDARQRYKEIGIRKVNGATTGEILLLLTRPFFVLVAIAFLIACPIAWMIIGKYMEYFSEKAPLSGGLFLGTALLTGLIAFLTLFWQSCKASVENPVNSLKSE